MSAAHVGPVKNQATRPDFHSLKNRFAVTTGCAKNRTSWPFDDWIAHMMRMSHPRAEDLFPPPELKKNPRKYDYRKEPPAVK